MRVGNGAWDQSQIDVYGELLGAAVRLADQLVGLDDDTRRFLVACADAAAESWTTKDQGIWEVRGEARDFLYSKVMCWVALDRAIAIADRIGAAGRVPGGRAPARRSSPPSCATAGTSRPARSPSRSGRRPWTPRT